MNITLFFGYQSKNLKIEMDIAKSLPDNIPAKRLYDKVGEIFPSRDFILVVVESDNLFQTNVIAKIDTLTKVLEEMPGIYSVMSPTNAKIILSTKEGMDVREAMNKIPETDEEIEIYKKRLLSNNVYVGNIISNDFKDAGIMLSLKKDVRSSGVAEKIIEQIQHYEDKWQLKILATGKPIINYYLEIETGKDMMKLFPLAILVVFIIPFFRFKKIMMTLIPLGVVIFSVIWTFGVMAMFRVPFSHTSNVLPILLISIGVADGIHVLNHYFYNSRNNMERAELVQFTLMDLYKPIIITSVTTMIGFLALNTSNINSLMQLGIFTSVGVFFAMILSLTFIPAVLSLMKIPVQSQKAKGGRLEKISQVYGNFIIKNKWAVLSFIVFLIVLSSIGIPKIKSDFSDLDNFPKDHPLRMASEEIDSRFAGSSYIDVVIEGTEANYIKDPIVLQKMALLQDSIKQLPHVGGALSLVDYIRKMNQVLHNDDPDYYRIPYETETEIVKYYDDMTDEWVEESYTISGRELVAQYLQLYEMSSKPEDFANIVNYNYQDAKITAFIKSARRIHLKEIDTWTRTFIQNHFDGIKAEITGITALNLAVNDLLVRGQFKSILVSLFLVFLITALMFRSFIAGFYNVLPLFFAIFLNFAIMGWFGINVELMTMVISSIAIGVGVDYAIHFYHRFRMKFLESNNHEDATRKTMLEAGIAIFINAMTVAIGFSILIFSMFRGVRIMGLLITLTMIWSSFGALTILPTLFNVKKQQFK